MRVISGTARGTVLHSIDDIKTRPTLDRVKESIFNIIQSRIQNSIILDLFSGSGAISIEFISRGASKAYLCDNSHASMQMIKQNLIKTKMEDKAVVYNLDYKKCLEDLKNKKIKFDIIFIDPPYKEDLAIKSIELIDENDLLKDDGIIIIETDEEEREKKELENINNKLEIYDLRKYGRIHLIFLKNSRKGKI